MIRSQQPRVSVLLALFLVALGLPATAEVDVRPLSVTVGSAELADLDFQLKPHGVESGTQINVLVSGFESSVIKLDAEASNVDTFVDSTGHDLTKAPKDDAPRRFGGDQTIGPFPKISEDGTKLVAQLQGRGIPKPGADAVTIDGTLVVLTATGTQDHKSDAFNPADKPTLTLGGEKITVQGVKPSDWEEGKFSLSLGMTTDIRDRIKAIKLLDDQGKELADGPSSTMTMNKSVTMNLTCDAEPKSAVLSVVMYKDLQTVKVPVRLTVGLGLADPAVTRGGE